MLNTEQCWASVTARDAAADGAFVYAVRTSGVYCRPACPSRLPLRNNVAFYETTAAAEAAGFRACKRCRPSESSVAERHVAAIGRACALIRERDTMPSLTELAAAAGISRFHFHRVFKQITGTTPREWGKARRIRRFAELLDGGESVASSVYAAGFGASSRAYEAAPNGLGMTPATRRRGGQGETIRHTIVPTPLGYAIVGATERGICMTALGDDPARLEAELRRRFPAAAFAPADAVLAEWAERIVGFITRPGAQPDLPLDISGTAFQAMVWRALQKIPPGHTTSYGEIAAALGRPTAVRAVARAIASNNHAVLVPCHRVVRGDGALSGYRWGVERKRALLDRERDAVAAGELARTRTANEAARRSRMGGGARRDRRERIRGAAGPARRRRMPRIGGAVRRRRGVPLTGRHGAAQLRTRRIQISALSAAFGGRGAARGALSAIGAARQRMASAAAPGAALSGRSRRLARALSRGRAACARRR